MAFDEAIDDEIDLYGDTVTLRVVPADSYNDRGDVNESSTPTDTTTLAVANILGKEDLELLEGQFQNGDKRFFFKTTETGLDNGNRIKHDGLWYEIEETLKHRLQNQIGAWEVIARKV